MDVDFTERELRLIVIALSMYLIQIDYYEETNHEGRTLPENIAHAQKRMVSMMARIAISDDDESHWVVQEIFDELLEKVENYVRIANSEENDNA